MITSHDPPETSSCVTDPELQIAAPHAGMYRRKVGMFVASCEGGLLPNYMHMHMSCFSHPIKRQSVAASSDTGTCRATYNSKG